MKQEDKSVLGVGLLEELNKHRRHIVSLYEEKKEIWVYKESDVLFLVKEKIAELIKELWDICVAPKHYDCDKCPFMNKDKEICELFTKLEQKFGRRRNENV